MKYYNAQIANLLDTKYARESRLSRIGIRSFSIALRYQETLTEDKRLLQQYREFLTRAEKSNLVPDIEFSNELARLKELATELYQQSGKYWDLMITPLEKLYWKEYVTDKNKIEMRQKPFLDEMEQIWQEELTFFNNGYAMSLEMVKEKKKLTASKLYKSMVGEFLGKIGYELDTELGSRKKIVFSKAVLSDVKLCFVADAGNLINKFPSAGTRDEATGNMVPSILPTLDTWIEVIKADSEDIPINVPLEWLFPIREFPLSFNRYCKFYQLNQLESLINMHINMYQVVEDELIDAIVGTDYQ